MFLNQVISIGNNTIVLFDKAMMNMSHLVSHLEVLLIFLIFMFLFLMSPSYVGSLEFIMLLQKVL